MTIDYNHKKVWDILIKAIPNPYGVAGLMGNLFAESSMDPKCVTGGGLKTKEAKEAYIQNVKDGKITPEDFSKDGIAFGLAQWRYWSRKEALYLYLRANSYELDDLEGQLYFLYREIQTYRTVYETLKSTKSIKEASDIVMERYEKPGNISEQAKAKRAGFGQDYYDAFALQDDIPKVNEAYVVTTKPNVNLRWGNGKAYGTITQVKTQGTKMKWIATAENGWHAVVYPVNRINRVLWVSPDFSELQSG